MSDVLRRNSVKECGQPVGQLNVVIRGIPEAQTISFYCTEPKLHLGACRFVGNDLIISKRDR